MRPSSGFERGLEGHSGVEDGPEDVHASARQGDDGGMMALSLAALAVVEGAAVLVTERAEGGLVEDAFEALVAAGGNGGLAAAVLGAAAIFLLQAALTFFNVSTFLLQIAYGLVLTLAVVLNSSRLQRSAATS